jgi:hypothetical protein
MDWKDWPGLLELLSLDDLKKRYEEGDKRALFFAVRKCVSCTEPVKAPPWVEQEISIAIGLIGEASVKGWEDIFARMYPKGTRVENAHEQICRAPHAWKTARKLITEEGYAVDQGLFDEVSKRMDLGARQVKEAYYLIEGLGEDLHRLIMRDPLTWTF